MNSHLKELLIVCGFKEPEIKREKSRIDKAFGKLGLSPDDIKTAISWTSQNHDIDLEGEKQLLGASLKELIDLVLSKDEGKRVIYFSFPSIQGPGMAIKAAAPEEIHCSCPEMILCLAMGQIFNKLSPIIESGEENGLPPGHGLCSLQQIRLGALAKGIIPVPDLIIGQSYYCDYGPKVDDLQRVVYGTKVAYIDGVKDSRWGEYPNYLPNRIEFLGSQLNQFFNKVEEALEIKLTQNVWDKAMSTSHALFSKLAHLARLMMADPVPISAVEAIQASGLAFASTGRATTDGVESLTLLCEEIEKRVESGIGILARGTPRILTIFPSVSDPSITHMIEEAGLAISALLFSLPPPKASQPIKFSTIGEKRAEMEMRAGLYHSSFALAKRIEDAVTTLNIDGVIFGYQYSCRPNSGGSHTIKKWIQERTGIPVLTLEMDIYDSRFYSAGALQTRIEAFADILRAKKAFTNLNYNS